MQPRRAERGMLRSRRLAADGQDLESVSLRHRPHGWGARRRFARSTAPPTCRESCSIQAGRCSSTRDDCWMSDQRGCARVVQARPGAGVREPRTRHDPLRARTGTRGVRGAHDLKKAEAVDGRPFERLRQDRVDSRADRLPLRPFRQRSAGRCRSIRRCRDEGWSARLPRLLPLPVRRPAGDRQRRSGSSRASGEMRSSPPGKRDDAASRFLEQVGPTRRIEAVVPETEKARTSPPSSPAGRGRSSVIRASGRFHGFGAGDRLTGDFDADRSTLGDPARRAWQEIFLAIVIPRDGVAAVRADIRQPRRKDGAGGRRRRRAGSAPRRSRHPRAALRGSRRSRARSAIQAIGYPADFSSSRVSASGRPTTFE